MVVVKKIVLDVLKPHKPSILELSKAISNLKGIKSCNIDIGEIERDVETVEIVIEGSNINIEEVKRAIKRNGATVHNIDNVTTGKDGK